MPLPEDDAEAYRLTQEMLRSAGERLVSAGWATWAGDTASGAAIEWTGKGIDRRNALRKILRDLGPSTMQQEHIMGLWLYLDMPSPGVQPPGRGN